MNSGNGFNLGNLFIKAKKRATKQETNIVATDHVNQRTIDSGFTQSNSIPEAKGSKRKGNSVKTIKPLSIVHDLPQPPVQGETHWVVPGRILAGTAPGDMTDLELLSIVHSGIDTFVNLQMHYRVYEMPDYRKRLRNMALLNKYKFTRFFKMRFLHYPIGDDSTLPDNEMWDLVGKLKTVHQV